MGIRFRVAILALGGFACLAGPALAVEVQTPAGTVLNSVPGAFQEGKAGVPGSSTVLYQTFTSGPSDPFFSPPFFTSVDLGYNAVSASLTSASYYSAMAQSRSSYLFDIFAGDGITPTAANLFITTSGGESTSATGTATASASAFLSIFDANNTFFAVFSDEFHAANWDLSHQLISGLTTNTVYTLLLATNVSGSNPNNDGTYSGTAFADPSLSSDSGNILVSAGVINSAAPGPAAAPAPIPGSGFLSFLAMGFTALRRRARVIGSKLMSRFALRRLAAV